MNTPMISPTRVHEDHVQGRPCLLLDVRSPIEHRAQHVEGAELNPFDRIDPTAIVARRPAGCPVYVMCQSYVFGC